MLLFIIINKNYYHDWAPMRVSSILGNSRHLFSHSVITMKVLAPTPSLPLHRSQGTLVKSQEVKSCLLFRSSSGFSAHSEGSLLPLVRSQQFPVCVLCACSVSPQFVSSSRCYLCSFVDRSKAARPQGLGTFSFLHPGGLFPPCKGLDFL